ncbi:MAG: CHASE domain-containing protein [Myxococcales bacterium]|nr:CHASE domain-containing protein [Myxococcales bacterium]
MGETSRRAVRSSGPFSTLRCKVGLLLILGLPWLAAGLAYSEHADADRLRFEREANRVVDQVMARLTLYDALLWAAASHLQAVEEAASLESWRAYTRRATLHAGHPGMRALGIIHALHPRDLPGYVARHRLRNSRFRVHPVHGGPLLLPIAHVEPWRTHKTHAGFDVASTEVALDAALRARERGTVQISAPTTSWAGEPSEPAVVMLAPYYRAGRDATAAWRRRSLRGFVYAEIAPDTLISGAPVVSPGHADAGEAQLSLHVADRSVALFGPPRSPDTPSSGILSKRVARRVYGRTWTFDIHPKRAFFQGSPGAWVSTALAALAALADVLVVLVLAFLTRRLRRAAAPAAPSSVSGRVPAQDDLSEHKTAA